MSLLDFCLSRRTNTANIAKKRLQTLILENKNNIFYCKYFIDLKKEIFFTIDKYIKITPNIITVKIHQKTPNTLTIILNRRFLK